jgi:hypothetical protein
MPQDSKETPTPQSVKQILDGLVDFRVEPVEPITPFELTPLKFTSPEVKIDVDALNGASRDMTRAAFSQLAQNQASHASMLDPVVRRLG